jgi:hypothetical protein
LVGASGAGTTGGLASARVRAKRDAIATPSAATATAMILPVDASSSVRAGLAVDRFAIARGEDGRAGDAFAEVREARAMRCGARV